MADLQIAGRSRSVTPSVENSRPATAQNVAMALLTGTAVPALEMRFLLGRATVRPENLPEHIGHAETERQINLAIAHLKATLIENGMTVFPGQDGEGGQ